MEVLKPEIIIVGKRRYRKNDYIRKDTFISDDKPFHNAVSSITCGYESDEACDVNNEIFETPKGFSINMLIPNVYFKYIIGKKGETKKRIEAETYTKIIIPSKEETLNENLVIIGHDKKGVLSAKTRVDVLVHSARQHQPFTHFLSLPVNSEQIINKFLEFKSSVLQTCQGERGLDESLFQNPKRLHLTIGTLVLLSNAEIEKAVSLLQSSPEYNIKEALIDESLDIHIQGLEYMNDDPSEVDVLYAKVKPGKQCDRLQMLVDNLVTTFSTTGLMKKEHDNVKLHVTVMNTLMRKDPWDISSNMPKKQTHSVGKQRESFDATMILKSFKEFDFGFHHLSSIHLSQRGSSQEDGYYKAASYVVLP